MVPVLRQDTVTVRGVLKDDVDKSRVLTPYSLDRTQGTDHVTEVPQRFSGGYDHSLKHTHHRERVSSLTSSDTVPPPDDCEKGVSRFGKIQGPVRVGTTDEQRKRKTRSPQRTLKRQTEIIREDLQDKFHTNR